MGKNISKKNEEKLRVFLKKEHDIKPSNKKIRKPIVKP